MWSYVWLVFLVLVIIWIPFVLIYGGMLFFMWKAGAFNPAKTQHPDPQAAIMLVGVLLIFLLLIVLWAIYAVLMGLRYSLSIPASVVESLKARKAMRRSIELSKGSRGRIFLLALMISFVQLGLVVISQGFFIIAAFKNHTILPVWAQILQQVVAFVTNSFIGPMYATGLTLFYYDQRIRKEGYDIEWMMEAAGLSWPPPWAGIDAENAHSAPGALAIAPGMPPEPRDSVMVEVAAPTGEGAAPSEPATPDSDEPRAPEIENEQH
jgi:hypothetical protein